MTKTFLAATSLLLSPIANAMPRNEQVLKDICVLNIYVSIQARFEMYAAIAADDLLDPNNSLYPRNSQQRTSYFDKVEWLAKKFTIGGAIEKYDAFISPRAGAYHLGFTCFSSNVINDQKLQYLVDEPTFAEVAPKVRHRVGFYNGTTNDEVSEKAEQAASLYISLAIEKNKQLMHELSLGGRKVMDGYLTEGIPSNGSQEKPRPFDGTMTEADVSKVIKDLRSVTQTQKNVLYWDSDYFTGWTVPNTAKIWKLYIAPQGAEKSVYLQALDHIEDGTFQAWWATQVQ